MLINGREQTFIAEVKTQSPYGYKSEKSFIELLNLAENFGDWISIHIDPLWGGSLEAITLAQMVTNKPILAKGLHSSDKAARQAIEYGATFSLIYDRIPDTNNISMRRVLLEFEDIDSIHRLISGDSYSKEYMYVHNSRDLRTGQMKNPALLNEFMNLDIRYKIQASNIKSPADVHPNATHFIVGEGLVEFCSKL